MSFVWRTGGFHSQCTFSAVPSVWFRQKDPDLGHFRGSLLGKKCSLRLKQSEKIDEIVVGGHCEACAPSVNPPKD